MPPANRAAADRIWRRNMGTSPTRELLILVVRPQNFVSPTAIPLFITSHAHKPEDLVQRVARSCYSSHPLFVASPSADFSPCCAPLVSLRSSRAPLPSSGTA